ncbi:flagellar basal body-associated FliL family protein [Profundibacter sp.]|uniref:flagellar basal body-associated FliL family protein n=1 Tax=Profundibacter sp. TaxID=3101071 RepID=UPI003D0D3A1A
MADEEEVEDEGPKKKSKMPLIIGLVLALAGGGGGFYAVQSGMLFGSHEEVAADSHAEVEPMPDVVFVPVDPLIINLGGRSRNQFLRFRASLEVDGAYEAEVAALLPRVLDILNGYLRAVDVKELEDPSALIRLRAQMLRRIQTVTGEGQVKDLLIMEFVLN